MSWPQVSRELERAERSGAGWRPSPPRLRCDGQDGRRTAGEASPINYGQDVRDWWWRPEDVAQPTSHQSRVVWTGSNPIAEAKGYGLRVYLTTIDNPRPEEAVKSLDYVSAMSESAPFLVALTVER